MQKTVIPLLSIVIFLLMIGSSMATPILPIFLKYLGATNLVIGITIALYGLIRAPLNIPLSFFFANKNPLYTAQLGLALVIFAAIFMGLSSNFYQIAVARLIEGIGIIFYVISALRILAEFSPREERGGTMGIYTTSLLLGSAIGPLPGGFIAEHFGARMVFFSYGLVVAIALLALFFIHKREKYTKQNTKITIQILKKTIKDRSILIVSYVISSLFVARIALMGVIIPVLLSETFKLREGAIGATISSFWIMTAIPNWIGGRLGDKIGRKKLISFCIIISSFSLALLSFSRNLFEFQVVLLILAIATGLTGPISAYIIDLSTKENLPISLGIFRTFVDVAFFLGPLLGGMLLESFKLDPSLFLVLSLYLLVSLVLLRFAEEKKNY